MNGSEMHPQMLHVDFAYHSSTYVGTINKKIYTFLAQLARGWGFIESTLSTSRVTQVRLGKAKSNWT